MAKILLLDDEIQISRAIGLHLEKSGHQISVCNNGLEGLQFLNNDEFDLVITDLKMPKVSGIDLLRKIKEEK